MCDPDRAGRRPRLDLAEAGRQPRWMRALPFARLALAGFVLALGPGCGAHGGFFSPAAFDRHQAASRPADFPPPSYASTTPASAPKTAEDAVIAVLDCASAPCYERPSPAAPSGPVPLSEQIRGQVVTQKSSGQSATPEVVPFAVVKILRDGQVVASTKADVHGRFTFANLTRGRHELILEAPRLQAQSNVTVGFAATDVVLLAVPTP
jgi:hypothetical protein